MDAETENKTFCKIHTHKYLTEGQTKRGPQLLLKNHSCLVTGRLLKDRLKDQ
jgi:hypothetical protein